MLEIPLRFHFSKTSANTAYELNLAQLQAMVDSSNIFFRSLGVTFTMTFTGYTGDILRRARVNWDMDWNSFYCKNDAVTAVTVAILAGKSDTSDVGGLSSNRDCVRVDDTIIYSLQAVGLTTSNSMYSAYFDVYTPFSSTNLRTRLASIALIAGTNNVNLIAAYDGDYRLRIVNKYTSSISVSYKVSITKNSCYFDYNDYVAIFSNAGLLTPDSFHVVVINEEQVGYTTSDKIGKTLKSTLFGFGHFPDDPLSGVLAMIATQLDNPQTDSTLIHELGHCFGLWHTHHSRYFFFLVVFFVFRMLTEFMFFHFREHCYYDGRAQQICIDSNFATDYDKNRKGDFCSDTAVFFKTKLLE